MPVKIGFSSLIENSSNWKFIDVVSEDVYVDLNKDYKELLFDRIVSYFGSKRKLAIFLGVERTTIYYWYYGAIYMPLDIVRYLDRYLNLNKFDYSFVLKMRSKNGWGTSYEINVWCLV